LKFTAKRAGSGAGSASGFVPICHGSRTLHTSYLKSKVSWFSVPLDVLFLLDDFVIALFWLAVFRCIGTIARQGGSSGAGEKQASDAAQKGENNWTVLPSFIATYYSILLLIRIPSVTFGSRSMPTKSLSGSDLEIIPDPGLTLKLRQAWGITKYAKFLSL
jgi:hypothetical protein